MPAGHQPWPGEGAGFSWKSSARSVSRPGGVRSREWPSAGARGAGLSAKVLRLSRQFSRHSDVVSRGYPHLIHLRDLTGQTAFLSLLTDRSWVVVSQVESLGDIRLSMQIGTPIPIHCGAGGRAILAFAPDELIQRVLSEPLRRWGPQTITDPIRLQEELHIAREQGYAYGENELTSGDAGICSPVFDHQGKVLGSIGIAVSTARLTAERKRDFAEMVKSTACALSQELGYAGSGVWHADGKGVIAAPR